jgi:hypothetical protein
LRAIKFDLFYQFFSCCFAATKKLEEGFCRAAPCTQKNQIGEVLHLNNSNEISTSFSAYLSNRSAGTFPSVEFPWLPGGNRTQI